MCPSFSSLQCSSFIFRLRSKEKRRKVTLYGTVHNASNPFVVSCSFSCVTQMDERSNAIRMQGNILTTERQTFTILKKEEEDDEEIVGSRLLLSFFEQRRNTHCMLKVYFKDFILKKSHSNNNNKNFTLSFSGTVLYYSVEKKQYCTSTRFKMSMLFPLSCT